MAEHRQGTSVRAPLFVAGRRRLVVSAERVRILADRWSTQWKRPPTNDELAGLIRQWIGEEILFREAIDRGLDQGDELVRRRLVQKMNGIARGLTELSEPSDGELRTFYEEHTDRYIVPARRSFRHIFFSTEGQERLADSRAAEILEQLSGPQDVDTSLLGDPFALATDFALVTAEDVSSRFGSVFAAELFDLQMGGWQGPVPSSFGFHLVEVAEVVDAHTPSYEEAQTRVRIDVDDQRLLAAESALSGALASQYEIEYTWDDGELDDSALFPATQIPDLDLLGTLAVLVPRRIGVETEPRIVHLDESGKPDWTRLMAELHVTASHGDIALAGGTPRRSTLIEPDPDDLVDPGYGVAAAEFAIAIRATSGATVVEGRRGWLGITCTSEEMAAWMIRALAAENITVRREGATVFLPIAASFTIEDEILDMVVATASTMHFFEDHIRLEDHEHE